MRLSQIQKHGAEIVKKYEAGQVLNALADEYKCGHDLIRKVLVSNGVKVRGRIEARANFMRLNPDALIDYIPTPQAILHQKMMLRKKHMAKKLTEPTREYPTLEIGKTGTETVSTRDIGKR